MRVIPDIKDQTAARYILVLADPNADPEAIEEAFQWINHCPENLCAFERVQHFMQACDTLPNKPENFSFSFQKYLAPTRSWISIAASIAIMIIAVGVFRIAQTYQNDSNVFAQTKFHDQFYSAVGETRSVVLPDGSSVILGGSTMISADYGPGHRKIELLKGQALFAVAKDADRPFIVKSANGHVIARGTKFDVKRESRNITVTLVHGMVDVGFANRDGVKDVRLSPGMQVRLSDKGDISSPELVDVSRTTSWQSGILRYENAALSSVIEDLNRYSTIPIVLEDREVGDVRVSGSVQASAIAEWLRGLASAFDIQIDNRNPHMVRLKSNRSVSLSS